MMKYKKPRISVSLQPFIYKGFKLTIYNNKYYGFKYEYEIKAITQRHKYLFKRIIKPVFKGQKLDIIYDPTSHKHKKVAIDYGKININELCFRMSCPRLRYV